MSSHGAPPSKTGILYEVIVDISQTIAVLVVGCLGIVVLVVWHRLSLSEQSQHKAPHNPSSDEIAPDIIEYELGWYHYMKAFDAHHGPGGSPERDFESGSFLRGLQTWINTRFLRGYTLDDDVYVCQNAPRVLRVHQAGHAPSFGSEFRTLVRPRRENGGLADAPLYTLDVMLPGDFPHTFLRLRDSRGLTEAYEEWLREGRIVRIRL